MVKLFCAVVGEAGSAFEVKIDDAESVSALKEAIAGKLKYTGRADQLQLFLAKTKDAAWLSSRSEDVKKLKKGEKTALIEALTEEDQELQAEDSLEDVLEENQMPTPQLRQVHVLVVVPEQGISAPIVSQDGVFDHCSDPFFSQFPTVDEVDDWLEFQALLPLTECQRLYIRSSYKSIAAQALSKIDPDRRKYAVITGTPGIGKSVFVYYVMWRLAKDQKRVLFFSRNGPIYFDGSRMFDSKSLPNKFNRQFWSPDLWCLVDSIDPTTMPELPIDNCSILLASTPRRDCIGEFKKLVPTPDVFYMPLWTKEELATIAPLYPHAASVWRNRTDSLGGVPRLVLQDIQSDPQDLLTSACRSCSVDDCIMLVSINSEINSKTKIIQALIHIRSEEPYRNYSVVYASELAMRVIARTKWKTDRAKMQSLLGSCDGNPLTQALCGYIFEPHAMDLLEQGGSFMYRKLFSGRGNRTKRLRGHGENDEYIDIPASPLRRQIVERVETCQIKDQLYVPRTSNYASIDAWMPNFGGFQMTVGKDHDIKGGAADDLAKLGPNGNRLFFLLPPLYYNSFTKKSPQSIEQFAIRVPYPEEL